MRVATPIFAGVSGRGRAFKERLLLYELHFGGFLLLLVMCESSCEHSRGFKEAKQSETGETDSKVAPVCHQGVSEVGRKTEAGKSVFSLKVPQHSPMEKSTTQGEYGGARVFCSTRSKVLR